MVLHMVMVYKRKNLVTLDPGRVVRYNQFLKSLDQTNDFKPINPANKNDQSKETQYTKDELLDDIIQITIEQLLQSFEDKYKTPFFTGEMPADERTDPNRYVDSPATIRRVGILPKVSKNAHKEKDKDKDPQEKTQESVPIRETVHIQTIINNIDDLLSLTDQYPDDPAIQYNINIHGLHQIREPLVQLNNMIGMKTLKNNIIDQILYFVQNLHKNANASGEFLHTVIYGPPGTGKTEIAKLMGQIYSKIGVLSKGTFKKVTRSELVAGYLGQTALKTREAIQDALGGVLFIDEAYALGNPEKKDSFAKECIDTLCEALSDHKDNLMVIIAGYEKELKDSFFAFNQGLDSRFTWRFKTDDYSPEDLYHIYVKMVRDIGWEIHTNDITPEWFRMNKDYFQYFGRDMETLLSKTKIAHSRRVFGLSEQDKKKISRADLDKGLESFLTNDEVKRRREEQEIKRQLYNTLYS